MNKRQFLKLAFVSLNIFAVVLSSSTAGALDSFFETNDVLFFRPGSGCSTDAETIQGGANVPEYKNPVYNDLAPDPSVVRGDNGKYYVYATSGILLESDDLVKWNRIADNWKMTGAPNDAGGARWAPDVTKVGDKFILTYTIPTGTAEFPGGGNPQIAYAVGDSAGGQFIYKGKLSLPYDFSIDSHIFVDEDNKVWMFWGGGIINAIELAFDGNTLSTKGASKQILSKGSIGSNSTTIEGAWVIKRNGWYYLTYSQGHYNIGEGAPDYRVLVARSKTVNGNYTPDNSMKPILEGKSPIVFPGHHSIVTDASGNDWMVYHGYFNGNRSTRSMNIDPITYDASGWPIVNSGKGPSSEKQPGSSGVAASNVAGVTNVECCEENGSAPSTVLEGNDNKAKIWNYLIKQMGFNDVQAAGVMGNIQQESGFDPKAVNPSSGAYGIIQWLGGRKTNLESLASQRGVEPSDLGVQLDHMKRELEGDYRSKVLDPLKRAGSTKEAADIWLRHFEIPCVGDSAEQCFADELNDTRLPNAETILKEYTGSVTAGPATPTGDCSGTEVSVDGMTIYNQEDPRWADEVYGTTADGSPATIFTSGCGPTAMATIITALTSKKVTPSETTAYAKSQNMYVPGEGSNHAVAQVVAENWGLKVKDLPHDVEKINTELRAGGMIITSGTGAAPFTSAGHYIAIRGVTDDGKWLIADSNGSKGQENSKIGWDPVAILGIANEGNVKVVYK